MELPPRLRQAVDSALEGVAIADLALAAKSLSERYRKEVRDGRLHISDEKLARAYIATRLPATFAAIHAALSALQERMPEFAPATLLDAGAGPGTVMWAASEVWSALTNATLLEASPAIRTMGERLAANSPVKVDWRTGDVTRAMETAGADLVTLAYVLDELGPEQRTTLVGRLWKLTTGAFVIIEPGTTAGWQRILAVRAQLIAAGAHILAPCAHALACPVAQPDWCHFSARVARSRVHRLAKEADVPWEDEKFIYLAASRAAAAPNSPARVLAPPEHASGRVRLKLCEPDGSLAHRLVTRREGDVFKQARRRDWGDLFDG
jgi:ribosomal protein RSM22 (predicted rRNA methylase)